MKWLSRKDSFRSFWIIIQARNWIFLPVLFLYSISIIYRNKTWNIERSVFLNYSFNLGSYLVWKDEDSGSHLESRCFHSKAIFLCNKTNGVKLPDKKQLQICLKSEMPRRPQPAVLRLAAIKAVGRWWWLAIIIWRHSNTFLILKAPRENLLWVHKFPRGRISNFTGIKIISTSSKSHFSRCYSLSLMVSWVRKVLL